jgi:hypothetical protein
MRDYRISRVVTPAASMALLTLDQAKAYLGITDTAQDALLTTYIDSVSAAVNNYCDRIFVRQGYSDQFRYLYHWLAPGKPLRTRQFPIATDIAAAPVLTVTENGAAIDPTGWEVELNTGAVYRLDTLGAVTSWTGTSIVLAYDGGYDDIPSDVESAAIDWLNARWASKDRDPALRREEIPDVIMQMWEPANLMASSVPPGARDLLAPYRLLSV